MNKPIFIISAGGHAKVLLEAVRDTLVAGFIETDIDKIGKKITGIDIISQKFFLNNYLAPNVLLLNGIGSVSEPILRKKVFSFFKKKGYSFLNIVHPTAYISKNVILGEGCQILAGSIVQTGSILGDNVIVNTGAIVDHNCTIGNHSHIAPGATLSGDVSIEDSCHIGCAATLIQGLKISNSCLVAAGAVVISNLSEKSRVAGVPAKAI